MGLHRSFNSNFNPIEAETRKRLFWVIRRMDTYVGAMLGLPRFLEDEDIDQDFPMEVDDEYITETEIMPMPEGSISVMSAFNAHTRIVQVLSKICRYVYPIKGTQSGGKNSVTYTVKYSKIRELEQDLAQWLDELPMALKPGGEAPHIIIRFVSNIIELATYADYHTECSNCFVWHLGTHNCYCIVPSYTTSHRPTKTTRPTSGRSHALQLV